MIKFVVVGDHGVGKSSILDTFTRNIFDPQYRFVVFDNYGVSLKVDGKKKSIGMWDTNGQEDYDRLRPLSYPQTDAFFMCFSVVDRESFDHISTKWLPELKRYCPTVPIVLVGTKTDLRDPANEDHITTKQGERLAKELKMQSYLECSAKDPDSVGKIIVDAIRILLAQDKKYRKATDKAAKKELKAEQKEQRAQQKEAAKAAK